LNAFTASLRSRILNDPYYRLRSLQEIQVAATLGITIDVNQAGIDDWLRLPGISIHQARTLVKLTQADVQFYCLDDIAAALNLPIQRLKLWQPLLSFHYYDPDSLETPLKVNPNSATVEELMHIPDVSRALATAIVQQREKFGSYRDIADFQQRLTLSGQIVAKLMYFLHV
jgi:DNA uptake protein ComE-like DNA-binding protein